ncbi:hypothetical protein [Neorhizobium sp. NCHU2750]|uniref:hypothetical protein n=1 Tax=Neorhizobium sp. NCHU2750 TaxID=1825976 RepID=UPI000E75D907|nr:hypothetical protein NCHU2750_27910 [Neorhizobium sp. NCHU2750]
MAITGENPLGEPSHGQGQDKVSMILEKWPAVELLLEQKGLQSDLINEVRDYVSDLRSEASTISKLRKLMVTCALVYVLFVNLLLVCMLFYHQWFFILIGNYGRVGLIVAVISSSVIIIIKILAGLFRTHGDRNKDEMLPPHLQHLLEVFKAAQGN